MTCDQGAGGVYRALPGLLRGQRRRPQHLRDLLASTDVELSPDVLDRIDEIVPPGTNVNPGDIFFTNPALADQRLRRRP